MIKATEQWEVAVIDQSRFGPRTDGHTVAQERGGFSQGIGEGVLRVYSDRIGQVAGHSWSTQPKSRFRDQKARNLVMGRLNWKKKAIQPGELLKPTDQ